MVRSKGSLWSHGLAHYFFVTVQIRVESRMNLCFQDSEVDLPFLWRYFCGQFGKESFPRLCAVYIKLRDFGWVPRSGLSFGCDFCE